MTILHIETSTNVCSVAVSDNGKCIFSISDNSGQNHASMLSPFIQQALASISSQNLTLNSVAVSSGPGSYTGLRIGVSTAKGLCYSYDIPLIGVDTLEILCEMVIKNHSLEKNALLCPMIDARRMEVYTAVYNQNLQKIQEISAEIINEQSYLDLLQNNVIYFFGNGAEKCKLAITHPNAIFIDNIKPLAENMISLAEAKFTKNQIEDVAYFEPFYLKEFQTTTPKKVL